MGQESVVKGHGQGPLVSVQRSLVRVKGHWSRVPPGQTIFYHQTLYESDPAEGLEVMIKNYKLPSS